MHRNLFSRLRPNRAAGPCALLALVALLAAPAPARAQTLDVSDWQVVQTASDATFTFPAGTVLQPGDYVVIARFADQAAFEAFHGVSLGANVHYFTNAADNPVVPMINGAETYAVYDAGSGLVDGPTPAFATTNSSHHRTDPEAAPWTLDNDTATPGAGVEAPDAVFSGLVISEASDAAGAGNYVYEFVELYYDADGGTGTNLPPAVAGVSLDPAQPQAGGSATVTATITDVDGSVVRADLFYRFDGGAFLSTAMAAAGGGVYGATLTGLPGDNNLDYYVEAEDDAGAVTRNPAAAPAAYHTVWVEGAVTANRTILFDHAHDQDAGSSGNWRIDDNFPDPVPAVPTSETSWNGQLSSWAFELQQAGHTVRSQTTAFSAAALAGVDLLIIPEPQNPFTTAEIAAVGAFVHAGGSLFFVADHNSSDRNSNGWDSASIFGGYSVPHISDPVGSDVETFCGALFGLHVHVKDEGDNGISGTFTNVNGDPANPVIHGSYGDVGSVVYHVGNTLSLWPTANLDLSNVGGLIAKDAGSPYIAAWSQYGQGRVVSYGDSSDMADGTGAEFHEDNWHEADHRAFFLNATMWLLANGASAADDVPAPFGVALRTWPNPFNPQVTIAFAPARPGPVQIDVLDVAGRRVRTLVAGWREAGEQTVRWNGRDDAGTPLPSGVYLVSARDGVAVNTAKVVLAK